MPAQPEPSRFEPPSALIAGIDRTRRLDALFVNAPLRDYTQRSRVNDFTLPVLGMGYLATYAAAQGFNVGVLDAEAHGLGLGVGIDLINSLAPRSGSTCSPRPTSSAPGSPPRWTRRSR